ncbi:hypothetical protein [Herbidospora sp. RD11066]
MTGETGPSSGDDSTLRMAIVVAGVVGFLAFVAGVATGGIWGVPFWSHDEEAGDMKCTGNLIAKPWYLAGSNGAVERYQEFSDPLTLNGKRILRITYNLHGMWLNEGERKDESALILDQPNWFVVSLANYGQNGSADRQTVDIPLTAFVGLPDAASQTEGGGRLDLNREVKVFHVRFWRQEQFAVDIESVQAC